MILTGKVTIEIQRVNYAQKINISHRCCSHFISPLKHRATAIKNYKVVMKD